MVKTFFFAFFDGNALHVKKCIGEKNRVRFELFLTVRGVDPSHIEFLVGRTDLTLHLVHKLGFLFKKDKLTKNLTKNVEKSEKLIMSKGKMTDKIKRKS